MVVVALSVSPPIILVLLTFAVILSSVLPAIPSAPSFMEDATILIVLRTGTLSVSGEGAPFVVVGAPERRA